MLDDYQVHFTPQFTTDKPVVVLIGGYTASAAESFIIMKESENRATLIGENSEGLTECLSSSVTHSQEEVHTLSAR